MGSYRLIALVRRGQVAQQEFDKARLDVQAGFLCRAGDRAPQFLLRHRADENLATLEFSY
jgi:hypothetical protein